MGSWNWQWQSNCYSIPWNKCASKWTPSQREKSFWLCQMHYSFHKADVYENLPYSRIKESKYLSDRKYQIETCYKKYVWWTKFYWYRHRYKNLKWHIYINGKFY